MKPLRRFFWQTYEGKPIAIDIIEEIISAQKRLAKIPDLHNLLKNPDYIDGLFDRIKGGFPNKNPPLWLILGQIDLFLKHDSSIETILISECGANFIGSEKYSYFIFTCSLFVYIEYVKLQNTENERGDA